METGGPTTVAEAPSEPAAAVNSVPPPPSPLSGGYLLIIIGEPHSEEHKQLILQRLAKGFLSWDADVCHVDLEKELRNLATQAPDGEESRNGERLIQFASESLVTEVLIQPQTSTLMQCARNLLSSFTRHRHIIHAGYAYAGNGSWALQDGTFSSADFIDAIQEPEAQRVIRAYENSVSIDIHCSSEGDWSTTKLAREQCTKGCQLRVNPDDSLAAGSADISAFVDYISGYVKSANVEQLLEPSDVVGNIRFSHPTLYVFPGGQGDAALFGINGFNMLVDGGYSRKSCFWDFTRHLDRLDAVMVTRINNTNINGIASVLKRKRLGHVYPQIGHFFCNIVERKNLLSPDGDKDRDSLLVDLLDEGQELVTNLRHLELKPHACYRDSVVDPINLYHKVGHGKLDMYVISPGKDSKDVKEFLSKWNSCDQKLFSSKTNKNEMKFPLPNLMSICALLVWQPANPTDTITRILFPGSTPQHKIFEGLEKLKHLEFLKHPVCTAKTIQPVTTKTKPKISDKISPETKPAMMKSSSPLQDAKITSGDSKAAKASQEKLSKISQQSTPVNNNIRPERGTKVSKLEAKIEKDKTERLKGEGKNKNENKAKVESKIIPIKAKGEVKSAVRNATDKKLQRTPSNEKKTDKISPPTPKKSQPNLKSENKSGAQTKSKTKVSPTATPAKSAKEANNRKVVESKIQSTKSTTSRTSKASKGISDTATSISKLTDKKIPVRKSKPGSPSKMARHPGSPTKSASYKNAQSLKIEKENSANKVIKPTSLLSDKDSSDLTVLPQLEGDVESKPSEVSAEVNQLADALQMESVVNEEEKAIDLETVEDAEKTELQEDEIQGDTAEGVMEVENELSDTDGKKDEGEELLESIITEKDDIEENQDATVEETKDDDAKETSIVDSQLEEETEEDVEFDKKLLETDDKISDIEVAAQDMEIEEEILTDDAEDKHVRDEEESEKERKIKDVDEDNGTQISEQAINMSSDPGEEQDKEPDGEDRTEEHTIEKASDDENQVQDDKVDAPESQKSDVQENEINETELDTKVEEDALKKIEKDVVEVKEHEYKEELIVEGKFDYNEPSTSDNRKSKDAIEVESISDDAKQKLEIEVKDIIYSAQNAVANQSEPDNVMDGDLKNESYASEEKMDLSSEKNKEEISPEEDKKDQKVGEDGTNTKSQPEEKISAMETSATTAPSMPEDERIPLDEINEEEAIEEKYIKEDTKEKHVDTEQQLIKVPAIPKLPEVITSVPFDQAGHVLTQRDIVKTPDEVADLPVHEEVDGVLYENFDVQKIDQKKLDEQTKNIEKQDEEPNKTIENVEQTDTGSGKNEIKNSVQGNIDKDIVDIAEQPKNDDQLDKTKNSSTVLEDSDNITNEKADTNIVLANTEDNANEGKNENELQNEQEIDEQINNDEILDSLDNDKKVKEQVKEGNNDITDVQDLPTTITELKDNKDLELKDENVIDNINIQKVEDDFKIAGKECEEKSISDNSKEAIITSEDIHDQKENIAATVTESAESKNSKPNTPEYLKEEITTEKEEMDTKLNEIEETPVIDIKEISQMNVEKIISDEHEVSLKGKKIDSRAPEVEDNVETDDERKKIDTESVEGKEQSENINSVEKADIELSESDADHKEQKDDDLKKEEDIESNQQINNEVNETENVTTQKKEISDNEETMDVSSIQQKNNELDTVPSKEQILQLDRNISQDDASKEEEEASDKKAALTQIEVSAKDDDNIQTIKENVTDFVQTSVSEIEEELLQNGENQNNIKKDINLESTILNQSNDDDEIEHAKSTDNISKSESEEHADIEDQTIQLRKEEIVLPELDSKEAEKCDAELKYELDVKNVKEETRTASNVVAIDAVEDADSKNAEEVNADGENIINETTDGDLEEVIDLSKEHDNNYVLEAKKDDESLLNEVDNLQLEKVNEQTILDKSPDKQQKSLNAEEVIDENPIQIDSGITNLSHKESESQSKVLEETVVDPMSHDKDEIDEEQRIEILETVIDESTENSAVVAEEIEASNLDKDSNIETAECDITQSETESKEIVSETKVEVNGSNEVLSTSKSEVLENINKEESISSLQDESDNINILSSKKPITDGDCSKDSEVSKNEDDSSAIDDNLNDKINSEIIKIENKTLETSKDIESEKEISNDTFVEQDKNLKSLHTKDSLPEDKILSVESIPKEDYIQELDKEKDIISDTVLESKTAVEIIDDCIQEKIHTITEEKSMEKTTNESCKEDNYNTAIAINQDKINESESDKLCSSFDSTAQGVDKTEEVEKANDSEFLPGQQIIKDTNSQHVANLENVDNELVESNNAEMENINSVEQLNDDQNKDISENKDGNDEIVIKDDLQREEHVESSVKNYPYESDTKTSKDFPETSNEIPDTLPEALSNNEVGGLACPSSSSDITKVKDTAVEHVDSFDFTKNLEKSSDDIKTISKDIKELELPNSSEIQEIIPSLQNEKSITLEKLSPVKNSIVLETVETELSSTTVKDAFDENLSVSNDSEICEDSIADTKVELNNMNEAIENLHISNITESEDMKNNENMIQSNGESNKKSDVIVSEPNVINADQSIAIVESDEKTSSNEMDTNDEKLSIEVTESKSDKINQSSDIFDSTTITINKENVINDIEVTYQSKTDHTADEEIEILKLQETNVNDIKDTTPKIEKSQTPVVEIKQGKLNLEDIQDDQKELVSSSVKVEVVKSIEIDDNIESSEEKSISPKLDVRLEEKTSDMEEKINAPPKSENTIDTSNRIIEKSKTPSPISETKDGETKIELEDCIFNETKSCNKDDVSQEANDSTEIILEELKTPSTIPEFKNDEIIVDCKQSIITTPKSDSSSEEIDSVCKELRLPELKSEDILEKESKDPNNSKISSPNKEMEIESKEDKISEQTSQEIDAIEYNKQNQSSTKPELPVKNDEECNPANLKTEEEISSLLKSEIQAESSKTISVQKELPILDSNELSEDSKEEITEIEEISTATQYADEVFSTTKTDSGDRKLSLTSAGKDVTSNVDSLESSKTPIINDNLINGRLHESAEILNGDSNVSRQDKDEERITSLETEVMHEETGQEKKVMQPITDEKVRDLDSPIQIPSGSVCNEEMQHEEATQISTPKSETSSQILQDNQNNLTKTDANEEEVIINTVIDTSTDHGEMPDKKENSIEIAAEIFHEAGIVNQRNVSDSIQVCAETILQEKSEIEPILEKNAIKTSPSSSDEYDAIPTKLHLVETELACEDTLPNVTTSKSNGISDPLTASYLEIIEQLQDTSVETLQTNEDTISTSVESITKLGNDSQDSSIKMSNVQLNESVDLTASNLIESTASIVTDTTSQHRVMLTASSEDGGDETELDTSVSYKPSVETSFEQISRNSENDLTDEVTEMKNEQLSTCDADINNTINVKTDGSEGSSFDVNQETAKTEITENKGDSSIISGIENTDIVDSSIKTIVQADSETITESKLKSNDPMENDSPHPLSSQTIIRGTTPTSDSEHDLAPSTPHSDISSGQMSRAPLVWDDQRPDSRHSDLSDKEPLSPQSTSSQPNFSFEKCQPKETNTMTSSFYGSLPEDNNAQDIISQVQKVSQGVRTEPLGLFKNDDSYREEDEDIEASFESFKQNLNKNEIKGFVDTGNGNSTITKAEIVEDVINSNQQHPSTSGSRIPGEADKIERLSGTTQKDLTDPIASWGKPLGLPAPAHPASNNSNEIQSSGRGTPKKEKRVAGNRKNIEKIKEGKVNKENSAKSKTLSTPMYFDLTYVPHHGNSHYTQTEFFKKIRARYYVFSGTEPSREVYSALLEGKETWDENELEVTIIPTYDTDTLGYWVAENEEALQQNKIDLSPSASRCTINLQDHETSCSAYRLEF